MTELTFKMQEKVPATLGDREDSPTETPLV